MGLSFASSSKLISLASIFFSNVATKVPRKSTIEKKTSNTGMGPSAMLKIGWMESPRGTGRLGRLSR